MRAPKLSAAILTLVLSACAHHAKTIASPPPPPVAQTPPQPPAHTATESDAAAIVQAERDLKTLGYAAGKSDEINDATLHRAILAFEKDQSLAEDGQLSPAVQERLKQLRFTVLGRNSAPAKRNALRVYSDGTISSTGLNPVPPLAAGMASDAAADFLRPARPGSETNFHLGHRTHEGAFIATKSVICHTGHMIRSNTAFGATDLLAVDCHLEGDNSHAWHSVYSLALDTVVQQDGAGKSRILVAIRPSTANWPAAARTGLDWAITHALESPASDAPVQWSSTGVAQHFEVRAFGRISGQELGLLGRRAALNCRRFELAGNDRPPSRYPGIACLNGNGVWTIAGTSIALSSPAKAVTMRSAAPNRNGAPAP